jgi:microcystin-dependent protein
MFAGNFAPRGYLLCQGQLLPIAQYTALFAILGTTYGGNGTSNFGLPDLRGRSPIGQGQGLGLSSIVLGEVAGVENVTILSSNMPIHNHTVNVSTSTGNQPSPQNNFLAMGGISHPVPDFPGITPYASSAAGGATLAPGAVNTAGSNVPISIRNPFLSVNYIIAINGIFPSRN